MLWPVVSSMRCWAKRPRREVCMPKNEETGIGFSVSSGLEVQSAVDGGCWGGTASRVGRAVTRLGLLADQAGEVRQGREPLAHQGAVDAVLASDLGEQAAQLGAPLHRGRRGVWSDQAAEALERDRGGGH